MITIKCSKCKGTKGFNLGDMITDCPHCFGTGVLTHDSVTDAVASDAVAVKRASRSKPKTKIETPVISTEVPVHESEAAIA